MKKTNKFSKDPKITVVTFTNRSNAKFIVTFDGYYDKD